MASSDRYIQPSSHQLEERVSELSLLVVRLTQQLAEQAEVISSLRSENQLLRDEVARLKGGPIKDTHLFSPDKRHHHEIQKSPIKDAHLFPPDERMTNKGHPLIFPRKKAPSRDSGITSKRRRVMCGDWSEVRLAQQVGVSYC